MKVQGNRYINNPEMIKNKVEKKTTVPQNIISEDDVKISDSARKLVETARNKVSDFHTMHFSSIMGEIREIPAEYKCENLFKLDLKATSISGEQSAFEGCSENQSEVFEKWLDENASEYLTEDEMKDLKEKINAMTADVDFLNAQEGYRGTSYESVFLLSASEAGLRKVNEMYVPEQFQAGFSDMIDEYVHFNDSARNSIMEKMTPDYMVVGIGSKTESYGNMGSMVITGPSEEQKKADEDRKIEKRKENEQKLAERRAERKEKMKKIQEDRRTIFAIGTDMKSITENVVAQAVGTAPSIGGSCDVKA